MYDPNRPPPPPGMMQTMGAPAQRGIPAIPGGYSLPAGYSPMARPAAGGIAGDVGSIIGSMAPNFADHQAYIDSIRAWIASRPEDKAGMAEWRAQMPAGPGQAAHQAAVAAAPPPVTQVAPAPMNPAMNPYPVTQLPAAQQQPVRPAGASPPAFAPPPQPNPMSYTSGFAQPPAVKQPRPAGTSGGFFGTRKGR